MCGIAGYTGKEIKSLLDQMSEAIRHRGPDDEGRLERPDLHLCMRRLSIIDVAGGRQPQVSEDGRISVFLNGEIYNYLELRGQLEAAGLKFRTRSSDTEVVLRLYEQYGVSMVDKLIGMFAIAIRDDRTGDLFLIRDRLGKKPIYFHREGGRLAYSSEFNGLFLKDRRANLSLDSLSWYFSQKAMPSDGSIDRRVRKIPPGHYLRLSPNGKDSLTRFYDVGSTPLRAKPPADEDAIAEASRLIEDSVRLRMRADVEVGAFLSGGVDSSLVVALASKMTSRPLKTYCLVYEQEINQKGEDRRWAREISKLYKTHHREVLLTPRTLMDELPRIVAHYGQPNSAVISNWFISREMGKDLKVALSGDGADELFGSYFLHRFAARMADPSSSSASAEDDAFYLANRDRPLHEVIDRFSVFTDQEQTELFAPGLRKPGQLLAGLEARVGALKSREPMNQMLEFDCRNLLVEQILNYADVLSMAHSLEVRTPFLDHRLVDFAFGLDHRFKIRNGRGKFLLKEVAKKHLPEGLIDRKKEGFVEPAVYWIRDEMKDFTLGHLRAPGFNRLGFLNPAFVERTVDEFYRRGDFYLGKKVWSLLMFALWEATVRD